MLLCVPVQPAPYPRRDAIIQFTAERYLSITCDMKFVLDIDVVVAGLRSPPGASAAILRLARRHRIELAISVPLVLEYEAVATRPEHLAASGLSEDEVQGVIDVLVGIAEWVRIDYRWRPQTRDPADEMVLEAAINAKADAIVTFNRRDFGTAPVKFGIGCWLPGETLEKLK
jgi:putative PIN family toxin of toxin-antitoxin system